ncbi:MAG: hypothetical protein ABL986_15115 [Vicinamibacterales bacterium]
MFIAAGLMLMVAVPAFAQVDISGEWARDNHEDQPHRAPGAELGDYTGMPINAAARRKAESWDASILSQPEQQAKPHPAQYSMRGPAPNFVVRKILDQVTGQLIAYTIAGTFGRSDRTIWMDGRKHPGEHAEHTYGGFSTGEWNGRTLKVTTTHMKTTFINRNGVPSSYKGTMIEFFTRHGNRLTQFTWIDDPVYLEEPFVRSNDYVVREDQHTGPAIGFETVDELGDKPRGWVPHWPIGTTHPEFAERFGLPFEATRGGRESLYPEYVKKIEQMKADAGAKRGSK